jgi:hypothetical protein
MSAVGADGRRYPVRPVGESKYVNCICGREFKGRAGFANHAKKCPAEQARSAAFVARIEAGA